MCEKVNREDVTFQELSAFLRTSVVRETTSRFWALLKSFVVQQPLEAGEMREARMLLTTLMIVKFPCDLFDVQSESMIANDTLADNCWSCAKELFENCFAKCPETSEDCSRLQCEEVLQIGTQFCEALKAFKDKDQVVIVESLRKYYAEWVKSKQVLVSSSMNDLQRNAVLLTIDQNLKNTKQKMQTLVGSQQTETIIAQIHAQVQTQALQQKQTPQETQAQKMTRLGVPSKMKAGIGVEYEQKQDTEEKESEEKEQSGMIRIDLDAMIREEGSKLYWKQFAAQIEAKQYTVLFEILKELLSRLKRVSPEKERAYLDELLDVSFIEHTLKHGVLDARGFYSIFQGLWQQMKSLHEPSKDKEWQQWYDHMCAQLSSRDAKWSTLLPTVLNDFLKKLDSIENAIVRVQPLLKKDSRFKDTTF